MWIALGRNGAENNYNYTGPNTRSKVTQWCLRVLFWIAIAIFASMSIHDCSNRSTYNSQAKICALGLHESPLRVRTVLDSLCGHNCVKFGDVITNDYALRCIYRDKSQSNNYSVGCQDTLTGDRLEIQFIILEQDVYDGECWMPTYFTNISRITLTNHEGINKANVSIDTTYLPGGQGFAKGYCATISDTCAVLYRDRQ